MNIRMTHRADSLALKGAASSVRTDSRQGANQSFTSTIAPSSDNASNASGKASDLTAAAGGAAAGAAAAVGLSGVASTISDKTGAPADHDDDDAATTTKSTKPATVTGQPALGAATTAGSDSVESLKSQLDSARREIASLKSRLEQAESNALRSRATAAKASSGGSEPGTAQAVVEQKGQDGVPVQTVVIIAAGVFVVTWSVVLVKRLIAQQTKVL